MLTRISYFVSECVLNMIEHILYHVAENVIAVYIRGILN